MNSSNQMYFFRFNFDSDNHNFSCALMFFLILLLIFKSFYYCINLLYLEFTNDKIIIIDLQNIVIIKHIDFRLVNLYIFCTFQSILPKLFILVVQCMFYEE